VDMRIISTNGVNRNAQEPTEFRVGSDENIKLKEHESK
jgi:hypothetical protein